MKSRLFSTLLNGTLVGYAFILVGFTHWPRLAAPPVWSPFFPPDKTLHLVAYGLLGGLAAAAHLATIPPRWPASTVLVALGTFALFDEVTQPLFHRTAEPLDFVADLCGILIGWALVFQGARVFRHWFKRRAPSTD